MNVAIALPLRKACGIADYARRVASSLPADWPIRWVDTAACRSRRDWADAARLAGESDVVHVHYEYTLFRHVSPLRNGYAAFMRALPVPAVVTLHDAFPVLDPPWARVLREGPVSLLRHLAYLPVRGSWADRQARRAARIIAHTQAIADTATRAIPASSVTCWPHPVWPCSRHWTPSADRPPILITPGFIKAHKGYADALDLLARHPDWHWWLAGGPQTDPDAAFLASLLNRARQLGIGDRLRVTGYLEKDDLEALAVQAQLAFFPFRTVTGSGSVSWAIGLHLPIAATDLPPLCRMREQGAGIRLLPAGRPEAWDIPLTETLSSTSCLEKLSAAAAAYGETFSYARFGTVMAGLLEEAAAEGRSGRKRPSA